jgi:hypothetical protein
MKHRYTIEELSRTESKKYLSDNKMIRAIIADRMGDCSNIYAPLYIRLQKLYNQYDKAVKAEEAQ